VALAPLGPTATTRGARDFANDVVAAGCKQGWHVRKSAITRSLKNLPDVGEDKVTFDGTAYVLTVTQDGPDTSCPAK
jgi:hypothetical protein